MSSTTIVEDLDVLEDLSACLSSSLEQYVANELLLQRREEAFSDGIVPAVAFAAHALEHAVSPEPPSKRSARVLAAAIAVEHQAATRSAKADGGVERRADEVRREPLTEVSSRR